MQTFYSSSIDGFRLFFLFLKGRVSLPFDKVLKEYDMISFRVDFYLDASGGSFEVLETAYQFIIQVYPNEIFPDGCQFLDKSLRLYKLGIFKQCFLGMLIGQVIFVFKTFNLLNSLPPQRAFMTGFSSKQIVELVDIDADEVDEVTVYARKVLSEVPDDPIQLCNQQSQLFAKINDLPDVFLWQIDEILLEKAIDITILDYFQQVNPKLLVNFIYYFFYNCLGGLLLQTLWKIVLVSEILEYLPKLAHHSSFLLCQRLEVPLFHSFQFLKGCSRHLLTQTANAAGLLYEYVSYGQFFERFHQAVLSRIVIQYCQHVLQSCSYFTVSFLGIAVIVYRCPDFVYHLLETFQSIASERPFEEVVIFEDFIVISLIVGGMRPHVQALQKVEIFYML